MIALHYPEYKHLFLTYGKVGSSTLSGMPSPKLHYDKKHKVIEDYNNGAFVDDTIVLMMRNPKDRFRSGLFTTLHYVHKYRDKTIDEWIDIITSHLKETEMFENKANSWEQYHCMPYLNNMRSLLDTIENFIPVHLNRLSDYLNDNELPVIRTNDSSGSSDQPNFYNAFTEAIKNFKTEYNLLLENDVNMYNSLLTNDTLSKKYL